VVGIVLANAAGAHAQRGVEDPATVIKNQQTESALLAARWLASGDARVRAWGAFLVLRDSQRQLLPRLATLVSEYRVVTGPIVGEARDNHHAMLAVLDAIIQLDGNRALSPAAIARLYPEFPAQALMLLSRPGMARPRETDGLLMDILHTERTAPGAWLTAANVLIANGVEGVAAEIVNGISIDMRVGVVDEGAAAPRTAGRGGSCPFGAAGPSIPGWPDVGNYYLAAQGGGTGLTGSSGGPVSRGPNPTFYMRVVSGPDPVVPHADFVCDDMMTWYLPEGQDWMIERLLASLAREPVDVPSLKLHVTRTIVWRGDEPYQRALWDLIGEQRQLLNAFLDKLVASGAMTADERRGRWPVIAVTVADVRGTRAPLPGLFNVGPGVTVAVAPQ